MNKSNKSIFFIVLAVTLAMAYVALFGLNIPIGIYDIKVPGAPDMRFGIDIRGGVDAVFEPKDLDRRPTDTELEAARAIIETRLDQQNILDRDVTIDKATAQILVRFPWASDETEFNPQAAIAELGETAKLTFRDPEGNIVLEGADVVDTSVSFNSDVGSYVVNLELSAQGTTKFDEATGRLIGQVISIYMDDTLISAPKVNERIYGGRAYIQGMANQEEALTLSNKIKAGALPFSMESRNHSTISPTLGSGALETMIQAGALAFVLICLFLLFYYRLCGLVACIALMMQTAGMLLALSIPQITLTLPGIAGVILSVGMGVDANIIISERISEEIKGGKPLDSSIHSGFKAAFSSVFDGNITVAIVAVILLVFGSGALLSFAYSLLTGVALNFIAGVTASRLMIRSLSLYKPLRKTALYTCLSRRVTL